MGDFVVQTVICTEEKKIPSTLFVLERPDLEASEDLQVHHVPSGTTRHPHIIELHGHLLASLFCVCYLKRFDYFQYLLLLLFYGENFSICYLKRFCCCSVCRVERFRCGSVYRVKQFCCCSICRVKRFRCGSVYRVKQLCLKCASFDAIPLLRCLALVGQKVILLLQRVAC